LLKVQRLGRSSLVPLAAKKADVFQPKSAKEAVETGLKVFSEEKNYGEAIRLFNAAMQLKPSSEEAAAALFNLGCAYARQRKWKEACDALKEAIDEHNLKLSVAVKVCHCC
jgi:tetratricopeptide (TPR) repeat protein